MAMILALVGVLSGIGRVVHQQQDLQDRADLASLAVAHTFRHTGSEQIACRKGRRLVGNLEMMCSVDGDSSRIITRAELTIGMIPVELEATARAGPYLLGVDD
ncbi:hypothetical protein JTE88_08420 [Arcanobacterium phocisimile]|uniref:Putative Flp pilus-assembly TadG-like N-terminal domain-containing protein n=1 Tax=Arcanobacterium phocisimile TaxID=1302235 RepID=A0ABX7IG35_9ACTO|nr:hypothetical protein [Arcanobacterium phocisimile]QRV02083.1 hypothetical protein JTE88_08420 [Arcanobacterium phocisimile]